MTAGGVRNYKPYRLRTLRVGASLHLTPRVKCRRYASSPITLTPLPSPHGMEPHGVGLSANYPHADHVAGLSLWVSKILEMTDHYDKPWNVLIADLWPNYGRSRLIGHVQMDDVAVGYDIGYRVCAYLQSPSMAYENGDDLPLMTQWLTAAVARPELQAQLRAAAARNPFHMRLTHWGQNPISAAIEIPFQT